MKVNRKKTPSFDTVAVGDVLHGNIIEYQNKLYLKLRKDSGVGITIDGKCSSLLANVNGGTVRLVKGATPVRVLDAELCIQDITNPSAVDNFLKSEALRKYLEDFCKENKRV